ncbi:MAG: TonB-dependent receptor [Acidobacteria bacterium]|nr:TonB-dependent receptor [Acidobacteriota bacterium]
MGYYKIVLAAFLGLNLLATGSAAARADSGGEAKTPSPAAAPASRSAAGSAGGEMILFQELPSIFGASKYEQKPSEAPAAISIVTADEIQKYGYRTLSEVLRSVRGIFTTYDRNYSYIGVRGFNRPGDYDTRILLLLDGHRLNDNVYDQAAIGTEAAVDLDTIERIEIIRGPSSSLYGTNAFLAVINVVTKSGRDLKGVEVSGAGGSFSTGEARAAYGARLDSGLEMYLSGAFSDSGGQDLFYPEYDGPATNNGWARDSDGDRFRRAFAKLEWGGARVVAGYSSRAKQVPTASYDTVFNDARERTVDERAFMDLRYEREVGRSSRLVGTGSWDGYWYKGTYPYSSSFSKDYGYGEWWTGEVQSITTLYERHKLIGGAEIRYSSRQDQGYYDAEPYFLYFKDRRQSSIWALYLQDEFRVRDGLILNVGVRHDDYDTFGGTTNPRLGAIWGVGGATTLKLLIGRAFRAPNVYELYYDDGGFSQKANPGLKPESIRTYEAALEHTFRGRLRGAASVYRYGITNLITLGTDPLDGLDVFNNVARARAEGVELEIEGAFGRFLEGRVSYALQRSEDASTGGTLTNSPRHLAKVNLTAPFLAEKLVAALEIQYTSSRETLQGVRAGGFGIANVTLLSRAWRKGPGLSLSIFNLLDKSYGDPGGAEHLQAVIPQDGRSLRAQVKYEF